MSGKGLFITIAPSNPDPMYKQITDQIKDAIAAGDLEPSDQLPSIREMAETLKISAITIKRAYQDLEAERFIITRAGLGSFVADKNPQEIRDRKLQEIRERIEFFDGLFELQRGWLKRGLVECIAAAANLDKEQLKVSADGVVDRPIDLRLVYERKTNDPGSSDFLVGGNR